LISDGYRVRNEELGPVGIPFVRGGNIGDGWIDTNVADHVRPEFVGRVSPKLSQPGDVAFITKGSVGRVGRLRHGQPTVVLAPQVAWWRVVDRTIIDPTFLFYLLRGPSFQASLYGVKTHGSMVADYVSISQQLEFWLRLPPIADQRDIARILGALDDKIELNRRMSETLETTARAIFESTLGPSPADLVEQREASGNARWAFMPFTDLVEVVGGGTPRTAEPAFWDGAIPWFSVVDAPNVGGVWVMETERAITAAGLASVSTRLLPIGTTILSARGTVGKVALVGRPMAMNQSCYGLISKIGALGYFTYFQTRALADELRQRAHGSVFDTITRDTLQGISTVCPPPEAVRRFEDAVHPLMLRMQVAQEESGTAIRLRDGLLPKLISGAMSSGRLTEDRGATGV